jgi:hypothetical protein
VDFYLDAGCPWTWLASRWLVDVAGQRDLTVRWRPFSLALLNEGKELPPQLDTAAFRERMATTGRALRVITALGEAGDHDGAGRFYTEFGRRLHDGEGAGGSDPIAAAATAAGVDASLGDGEDGDVDSAVASRLQEALAFAGPDIGSPVLRIDGATRGFHGPIVSPRPTGEAAAQLFDAIAALQSQDGFFEVKRGRTGPPALGSQA